MPDYAHEHAFWLNIARSFKKSQINGLSLPVVSA